jgi:membrane protease YdiL (CAAX protease family)
LTTLQGRPAPGLYVLAWLLTGVGFVLLLIGALSVASDPLFGGLLVLGSLLVLLAGLSSAAGYQIVARRLRPEPLFRGPSPAILFGLQFVLVNIASAILAVAGVPIVGTAVGFLIASVVLLACYLFIVWLYGIRSGALDLRSLGVPIGARVTRLASDIAIGAVIMLVVAFADALWGSLIAALLNTTTPDVVPVPSGGTDIVFVALGACLIVPIGEELFFRGYSVTAWMRDLGTRSALIRSTLFFALVHIINVSVDINGQDAALNGAKQALLEFVVIAPVGLVLGWLFIRRGLVASIAGHAAFNFLGVLTLVLTTLSTK